MWLITIATLCTTNKIILINFFRTSSRRARRQQFGSEVFFCVLVNSIVKIVQLRGDARLYIPLKDGEVYDENNPKHVHRKYKYAETCEIVVGETDIRHGENYAILVLGKTADLVAQVEKCSIELAVKTDTAIRSERS